MKRTLQILRVLELRLALSAQTLAEELGVSTKTVAKEVADLNSALIDSAHISLDRGIYRLTIFDRDRYLLHKNTLMATKRSFNDPTARPSYIFQRLLELDRPVISDALASEMNVSRSTVNADVAKLRELVADYGLAVEGKPNSGFTLNGSELAIRLVILDHFYTDFFTISPIPNVYYEQMVEVALKYRLEIAAIESLERWFTVLIDRLSHGASLDQLLPNFSQLTQDPAYRIGQELVQIAQGISQQQLTEVEAIFLTLPLAAMRGPNDLRALTGLAHRDRAKALYRRIQEHITATTCLALPFETLHEEFLVHLGFLLNRISFCVQITEDSSGLEATRYPLAFQLAHLAADVIEQETGSALKAAEVSLLAAYFQVTLDDFYARVRQQLRIAVVYRHGRIEGHLLQRQVETALTGVGSVEAIHQDDLAAISDQDYDLAIAHPGVNQETSLPLLVVADQVDLGELRKAIDSLCIQKSGGLKGAFTDASWLASLLTTNLFFPLKSGTYQEQLEELLDLLLEGGSIDESFRQAMLQREEEATMQLSPALSFPHIGRDREGIMLALGVSAPSKHLMVLAALPASTSDSHYAALVGLYQEVMGLSHDTAALEVLTGFTQAHQFRAFMASRKTTY